MCESEFELFSNYVHRAITQYNRNSVFDPYREDLIHANYYSSYSVIILSINYHCN